MHWRRVNDISGHGLIFQPTRFGDLRVTVGPVEYLVLNPRGVRRLRDVADEFLRDQKAKAAQAAKKARRKRDRRATQPTAPL
jgi:hypothetical protein